MAGRVPSLEELRARLTSEQFHVTQERGTERPFTGGFCHNGERGRYDCICCGQALFASDTQYDSGSGWPSFWLPLAGDRVAERRDPRHGMVRIEAACARCGAHLGHVFDDGPQPSGRRYCINSAALAFRKDGA